jgi:oxygen-independent coproporphyrinogen-3 oxidase
VGRTQLVSSVHFGGGTPNILSPAATHDLFTCLKTAFHFTAATEIAVEIDPRNATPEIIECYAQNRVTRVSLGVQDFHDDVQILVNRIQPESIVQSVVNQLRDAGIHNINFDLMYGLPGQTMKTVEMTAQKVVAFAPHRIALFSYAHVPQMKPHQRPLEKAGLPGSLEKLAMEQTARGVFQKSGYRTIGMDHFCLPNDSLAAAHDMRQLHRNFQGYTECSSPIVIGLGASAISQTPNGFFQNARDINDYQTILATRLPINRGTLISQHDRFRAIIIEQLMCYFECDIAKICVDFGEKPPALEKEYVALRPFIDARMITWQNNILSFTSAYPMAIRSIARIFDEYAIQGISRPTSRVV